MKKIIFIDLDGTLKNSQKEISAANRDALIRARDAGNEIVIATGRSYHYIDKINKQLKNVCRYAVSSTGSIVYDLAKRKPLVVTGIPLSTAILLCKSSNPELDWLIHCTDGLFSTAAEIDQNGVNKLITQPIEKFLQPRTVCEMTVVSPSLDLIKSMEKQVSKMPDVYISNRSKVLIDPSFPSSGKPYFDIVAKGVSKGSGVKALCDILGIPRENRIAIGDDINDLSMFAECGHNAAMGNALPEVKKVANHITSNNDNDGVAEFLFALIKKDSV